MQPQQNFESPGPGEQFCAQCGSPMPKQMRFCRACGNRLGEGPAEYTETVRFPGATTAANRGGQTTPFYPTFNAPMATVAPRRRRRLGWKGTTWLWISLVAVFGMGGLMSLGHKGRIPAGPAAFSFNNRSFVGVDDFRTTDGGATFKNVEPPGSPADKAGMVGGDIVTSFDGHTIREANEVTNLLENTPIGKSVEVVYLRDGISHTTQLTTISRDEYNRLDREYNRRSDYGRFGFERGRMTVMRQPETKTFGVRIDWVETNSAADLFGIKRGDIITDFDDIPIRTPDEFYMRVRRTIPYTTVNITLLRDGQKIVVPVKIGKA